MAGKSQEHTSQNMALFQQMSTDEKKVWKTAAKDAMKTAEFKTLQRAYRRFINVHGPGLGAAIPHETF